MEAPEGTEALATVPLQYRLAYFFPLHVAPQSLNTNPLYSPGPGGSHLASQAPAKIQEPNDEAGEGSQAIDRQHPVPRRGLQACTKEWVKSGEQIGKQIIADSDEKAIEIFGRLDRKKWEKQAMD